MCFYFPLESSELLTSSIMDWLQSRLNMKGIYFTSNAQSRSNGSCCWPCVKMNNHVNVVRLPSVDIELLGMDKGEVTGRDGHIRNHLPVFMYCMSESLIKYGKKNY